MPEPLKNRYNTQLVDNIGNEIINHFTDFDQQAFNQNVFDKDWKNKELKQRMRHIAECLHTYLPANYKKSIKTPHFTDLTPQLSGGPKPCFYCKIRLKVIQYCI